MSYLLGRFRNYLGRFRFGNGKAVLFGTLRKEKYEELGKRDIKFSKGLLDSFEEGFSLCQDEDDFYKNLESFKSEIFRERYSLVGGDVFNYFIGRLNEKMELFECAYGKSEAKEMVGKMNDLVDYLGSLKASERRRKLSDSSLTGKILGFGMDSGIFKRKKERVLARS